MAKYVSILSFTDTGVRNLRKTTRRARVFQEKMEQIGIKISTTLWTVGQYDLIHIFEAPDDKTAATFSYTLSSLGNVRTHTMRAFDVNEMEEIIENVLTPYDLLREQMARIETENTA